MPDNSELMTGRQFAQHIGVSEPYVTRLKKAGRLVMEGRRIDVERSKRRIADTRDPARQDVVDRHKAAKRQKGTPPPADDSAERKESLSYASARARRETALAEAAELDLLARKGDLCQVADVERAIAALATQVRSRFERLADRLAPEVAALADEQKVRTFILGEIDDVLDSLADDSGRTVTRLTDSVA